MVGSVTMAIKKKIPHKSSIIIISLMIATAPKMKEDVENGGRCGKWSAVVGELTITLHRCALHITVIKTDVFCVCIVSRPSVCTTNELRFEPV